MEDSFKDKAFGCGFIGMFALGMVAFIPLIGAKKILQRVAPYFPLSQRQKVDLVESRMFEFGRVHKTSSPFPPHEECSKGYRSILEKERDFLTYLVPKYRKLEERDTANWGASRLEKLNESPENVAA